MPVRLSKAATKGKPDDASSLKAFDFPSDSWMGWEDFLECAADMFCYATGVAGSVPRHRLGQSDAVRPETRIGIRLSEETRSAAPGQLYAGSHLRTAMIARDGTANAFTLGMQVEFDGKEFPQSLVTSPIALGGKGRPSAVATAQARFGVPGGKTPSFRASGNELLLRLIAVTPVPVDPARPFGLPLAQAVGEQTPVDRVAIDAAVTHRPINVGLWRGARRGKARAQDSRPNILRVFPPGSTWFVRLPVKKGSKAAQFSGDLWRAAFRTRLAPPSLAAMGFGAFVAGNWPDRARWETK